MNRWKTQPVVSAGLVIINVVVFLLCILFPGSQLYALGRLDAVEVLVNREYGRIVWAMFLHAGIQHIVNNMLIVFFMGAMIEKEVGHICYAVLYFLSGIGGNLLSLLVKWVNSDASASIGASGAVFGMDGVLLAMVLFSDRKMANVTPGRVVMMIVLSLYSGFSTKNIDNAAHVGGLIVGFLGGCLVCMVQRRRR